VAYYRSGSTVTSEIFDKYPNAFYLFEPLVLYFKPGLPEDPIGDHQYLLMLQVGLNDQYAPDSDSLKSEFSV